MMYKAFLFDMDGTIVDTFDLIHSSFNRSLRENNKRQLTKKEFDKKLFGKPVDSSIYPLIGTTDREETKKILKSFERYWLETLPKVKVFKNVQLTLGALKDRGCKLGVVSTSPRNVIAETLRQTGIYDYFDVLIGEEDAVEKKPHREPVVNALKRLEIKPHEAVFVGDTVYDVMAGKSAGCHTVFLLNEYNGDALERETPDRVIGDIYELVENGKG